MNRKYAVNIDMDYNELIHARVENVEDDPDSLSSSHIGTIIFNTTDSLPKMWTGSGWLVMSNETANAVAFSGITTGTNTQADMVIGSGATLGYTGSGTIDASSFRGNTIIPISAGGTGGTSASEARTNLGVPPIIHTHSLSQIVGISELGALLIGVSSSADMRSILTVYSEGDVNAFLADKADIDHEHVVADITDFPELAIVATSGSIFDLSDVQDTSYTNNQVLAWNTTNKRFEPYTIPSTPPAGSTGHIQFRGDSNTFDSSSNLIFDKSTNLLAVNGSISITGNLSIGGTLTTVNTTELAVDDNQIRMNRNVTGSPTLNATIAVERGTSTDAVMRWNESLDLWEAGASNVKAVTRTHRETIVFDSEGGTTKDVTHNLNTENVQVQVYEESTGYLLEVGVEIVDSSQITLHWGRTQTNVNYDIIVLG